MNTPGESWTEVRFRSDPGVVGRVLVDEVAPVLLARASEDGGPVDGGEWLWLRGLGGDRDPEVSVQIREPPTASPGRPSLAAELAAALRGCGASRGVPVHTGPARRVPLAGSVFSGPGLPQATRTVLATVTPALLAVADAGRAGRARLLGGALDLALAHLPALGPSSVPNLDRATERLRGAPIAFLSLRSHAEAFLATSRDPAASRAAFDTRYEAVRDQIEMRVREVVHQATGGQERGGPAARWARAMRLARPIVEHQVREGTIWLVDESTADRARGDRPPSGGGTAGWPGGREDLGAASAFHRAVEADTDLLRYLRADPGFLAVRVLTSLLYLGLHNLGLSLVERYFLCHAVSRACEAVYQVDALDVLGGIAG